MEVFEFLCLQFDLILGFPFQMALLPEGTTELLHHDKLLLPLVCVLEAYI